MPKLLGIFQALLCLFKEYMINYIDGADHWLANSHRQD